MSIPRKIYELNMELNKIKTKRHALNRGLAVRAAILWQRVIAEKDPASGKLKHTNDDNRKHAFELLKSKDEIYKSRRDADAKADIKWFSVIAEIEMLRGERDEETLARRERLGAQA